MINQKNIRATWDYIRQDHDSWPLRFWLEVFAWVMSIGAALLFALTVPAVPFYLFLGMTIMNAIIYTWAAWTRGSSGMLANYLLLATLDTIALIRLLV